jgi:lipid-A-disaccharide synthase
MKYLLIAGEASGDLHGANLMKSLKTSDQQAVFLFFGGDLMKEQGGQLLRHYRDMAFMGAIDVILNAGKIKRNFDLCRQSLLENRPDVVILLDYPGFNLKVAEFAHQNGIPVFYYILPKVWAWKEWRVKALKAYVQELFSILPFEVEFFRKHGVQVRYVGNPILDAIASEEEKEPDAEAFTRENNLSGKPVIALLPGSRAQEIRMMLPVMTRLASDFRDFQFVISGAPALHPDIYRKYSVNPSVPVVFGKTYELLRNSYAAVVTSGTATLETALLRIPQVVLYKMAGGKLGFRIFRALFLKVKYVSLPNLILDRGFLKEFIMDEMQFRLVRPEVGLLIRDREYRRAILSSYEELRNLMGEKGASDRAAAIMTTILKSMPAVK